MNQSILHRGISVFFLALALADPCCLSQLFKDQKPGSPARASSATAERSILATDSGSSQDKGTGSDFDDSDCFCCAHVLPSVAVELSGGFPKPAMDDPEEGFLPKPPPRNLFRPPRAS